MTAHQIRETLDGKGEHGANGRIYIRRLFSSGPARVIDARERKGETQVKLADGWYTRLIGDEVFETG